MAIVTTYTCDKCGYEQTNPEQMWEIGVALKAHINTNPYVPPALKPKALWCRACVEGIGLLIPSPKPKAPAPEPATLEDIVRELIQEEMDQS